MLGARLAAIAMLLSMNPPAVLSVRKTKKGSHDGSHAVLLQAAGMVESAANRSGDTTSMLQAQHGGNRRDTLKVPNGLGCPIVNIDATLYSGTHHVQKHQWTTSFIGALDYALGKCQRHGASNIQSEHVQGRCVMLEQSSSCCGKLHAAFADRYPGHADMMKRITTNDSGHCFRLSDPDADFQVFPEIIELTGADCIFAKVPIGGSLISEVYIGDDRLNTITNPALAYTLGRIPESRPIKCDLKDAGGTICPEFGKNTQLYGPDPRGWATELAAEADKLDRAGLPGSSIPYHH